MEVIIGDCPLGAKCEEPGQKDGKAVIVRCPWYTMVRGHNPNTDKETDDWGCAIAWGPALLINAANESRKTSAAVEGFRNKMVSGIAEIVQLPPKPKEKMINGKGNEAH